MIEIAISLIREAKGDASVVDHLDAAEVWLGKAQELHTVLLSACKCALGYLTQGMDGDFSGEEDPVEVLREAIAKAGAFV